MKRPIVFISLLASLALSLSACNSESPVSQSPPESYSSMSKKVPLESEEVQPKLDILFVIDNSNSMGEEQLRLSQNIQRFVNQFAKDGDIDFHIGVVSVFDSENQKPSLWPDQKIYPSGELRPLKDPKTNEPLMDLPPYVSSEVPNYVDVLASTILLGIHDYLKGGPIIEESFSPVVSALSEPMISGPNKGFLRPDSHFAVVMITDADDSSPTVSASGLDHFLRNLRGQDDFDRSRFSTYAVLADPEDKTCVRDKSGPPIKILEFINITGGEWFSLCNAAEDEKNQFGENLAEIGAHLADRVNIEKEILLDAIPEMKTLKVRVNGEELQPDKYNGWLYDPERVSLVLRSPVGGYLQHAPEVEVQFTPAKLKNLINGRSYRLGQ